MRPQRRGQLVTLATQGDRTIFFDFLPLSVKEVRGFSVRFLLYTVPGQTFYAATRELVLKGADGVVFVVDSSPSAEEANRASLDELGRSDRTAFNDRRRTEVHRPVQEIQARLSDEDRRRMQNADELLYDERGLPR